MFPTVTPSSRVADVPEISFAAHWSGSSVDPLNRGSHRELDISCPLHLQQSSSDTETVLTRSRTGQREGRGMSPGEITASLPRVLPLPSVRNGNSA